MNSKLQTGTVTNAVEWRACDDPAALLGAVGFECSERKLNLFRCAVCGIDPADEFSWLHGHRISVLQAVYHDTQLLYCLSEEQRRIRECFIRDIFGNPYSTIEPNVSVDPLARELARACYQVRLPSGYLDPMRLARCADAAEKSALPEAVVLHLREPGPHVFGCFAVDLLVGEVYRASAHFCVRSVV